MVMRSVQFSEGTIDVALPSNNLAGNGIHCDGIPHRNKLGGNGFRIGRSSTLAT
jgi:hypothetical protein